MVNCQLSAETIITVFHWKFRFVKIRNSLQIRKNGIAHHDDHVVITQSGTSREKRDKTHMKPLCIDLTHNENLNLKGERADYEMLE